MQATVSAVLRVLAQAYQRAASPIPGTKQLPPGPPLISLRVTLPRDEGTAGWMGAAVDLLGDLQRLRFLTQHLVFPLQLGVFLLHRLQLVVEAEGDALRNLGAKRKDGSGPAPRPPAPSEPPGCCAARPCGGDTAGCDTSSWPAPAAAAAPAAGTPPPPGTCRASPASHSEAPPPHPVVNNTAGPANHRVLATHFRQAPEALHFSVIYVAEAKLTQIDSMNSEEEFFDAETGLESDDSCEVSFKDALVFDSKQVTDGSSMQENGVWEHRKALPAETISRNNFSVWSILKKCIGMELSKIAMPVVFNEPLSFLQRISEYMEHTHLIHKACSMLDAIDRMQVVAAFAVSAVASQWERTGKPFNPLLGETYELIREDEGYRLISEQVSHHPPISAFHAQSLKQEFEFHGSIYPKLKFWGKSVEAEPKGTMTLELLKHKEAYTWTNPLCCVHNIILGKLWIEQYGTVEIVNHSTGDKCILNFKPCGMFGKDLHKVEGFIEDRSKKKRRVIYGKWTECVYSIDPKLYETHKKKTGSDPKKQERSCEVEDDDDLPEVQDTVTVIPGSDLLWRITPRPSHSAQMYNFTSFAVTLNELEPGMERLLAPTDCRLRPDIRAMEHGDIDLASAEKERLEEKQRAARRERSKDEEEWSTRWFRMGTNPFTGAEDWRYTGGYFDRKYTDCPNIY